jgi:plasmid stabilization system protein ParE
VSFDEEHLDEHYLCQREVAERDQRIRELEAALREIADFAEQFIGDDEDGDERMYKVHQIADNAIPFTSDAAVDGEAKS